jgi:hypothetical protein
LWILRCASITSAPAPAVSGADSLVPPNSTTEEGRRHHRRRVPSATRARSPPRAPSCTTCRSTLMPATRRPPVANIVTKGTTAAARSLLADFRRATRDGIISSMCAPPACRRYVAGPFAGQPFNAGSPREHPGRVCGR